MDALGEQGRAHGRRAGGFEHDRAAGGEGGRDLAHGERERKVPGTDRRNHANGRLDDQVTFALGLRGDDPAVAAARLLGKPAQVIDCHRNLAAALREGLAVLERDRAGKLVLPVLDPRRDLQQKISPRLSHDGAPGAERRVRIGEGLGHGIASASTHLREGLSGRGIEHRPRLARRDKLAVEIERICFHGIEVAARAFRRAGRR